MQRVAFPPQVSLPRLPSTERLGGTLSRPFLRARRHYATWQEARQRAAAVQGTHGTITAINDGVLTTRESYHRAVLSVAGPGWARLPEREQDALLDHYAWLVQSLVHPIQWLCLVRRDSLNVQAGLLESVREQRSDWSAAVQKTSRDFSDHLRQLGTQQRLRQREALLVVPTENLDFPSARDQLTLRASDLAGQCQRIGVEGRRLTTDALAATVRSCWYPNLPPEALTPSDLAPNGIRLPFDGEAFVVDHGNGTSHWLRGYKLTDWPERMTGPWLLSLLMSDVDFDLSVHITPLDDSYKHELREREQRHSTAVSWLSARGWPLWDGLQRAHGHVVQMREQLEAPGARGYHVSVTTVIRAENEEALDRLSERAERALQGSGARWTRCTNEHHLAARNCRPEGVDALSSPLEADLGTVAHLFPALSGRLGQQSPGAILHGFDGDQPVLLDPFDARTSTGAELNSTVLYVGPPGSGKSVRTKAEMLWSLLSGREAVVFDIEGEYRPLAELFAARTVVPGTPESEVNPFTLSLEDQERNPVRSQVRELIALLEVALGSRKGGLTDEQVDVLDDALIETYRSMGITPDDPGSWSRTPPHMPHLADLLGRRQSEEAQALARAVKRYSTGSLAGLFGPRTKVAFDRQMVRFDLRGVEKANRPLAIYLALMAVWQDQLSRPRERLVLVDEAWQYFALPHAADQLETVALRGRKWRLGPRYVFHHAEQFSRSPQADSVRQSAAAQILLHQTEQSIDGITKLWHLSDQDRRDLLTANKGSGLLFTGQGHTFVSLDLSTWPCMPLLLTGLQAN